jgi:hypothetical protein
MVTFECKKKTCSNFEVKFDFIGNVDEAECGACATMLKSKDLREDPKSVIIPMGSNNEI